MRLGCRSGEAGERRPPSRRNTRYSHGWPRPPCSIGNRSTELLLLRVGLHRCGLNSGETSSSNDDWTGANGGNLGGVCMCGLRVSVRRIIS